MKKPIKLMLTALTCTTMIACSSGQQSSTSSPSSTPSSSDKAISTRDAHDDAEAPTVDAREFLDTFLDTQKCVVQKRVSQIANSDEKDKPSADDISKMNKALEEKSQDTSNKNAAWSEISQGCNNSEISSMHKFFSCQQEACGEHDLSSASEKHKACPEPTTGEGCEKSFRNFMNHFSPF